MESPIIHQNFNPPKSQMKVQEFSIRSEQLMKKGWEDFGDWFSNLEVWQAFFLVVGGIVLAVWYF
jgi:hypothetical protein